MATLQAIKDQAAFSFNPRRLKLTLLPTEQCNFRCRYCYEDFKIGKMTPRVVSAIKSLLTNRGPELERLDISWFGGEPLVAKEIVHDIQAHAFDVCEQYGVHLNASMTTNGYLLNADTLQTLSKIGVKHFQISLDGKEDVHNKNRVLASGAGTFDKIWNNLLSAARTDIPFEIALRIHITAQNLYNVEDFVEDCWASFAYDQRFAFFFKKITNLGGSKDVVAAIPDNETATSVYNHLLAKYPTKTVDHGFQVCYAAQPNAFVVRSDGRLARCTVAFGAESNHVGAISGHGEMSIDIEKLNLWFKGFTTLDEASLTCPLAALRLY
jgi:uncharacterized protein